MSSIATHFTASLFLCPFSIRRLLCSFSLYLNDPSQYRSRICYFSEPKWKNIDFYTLLIALPIASFSNLLIFLAISTNPNYKFSFLQQSFIISLFWALLILIQFKESSDLYSIPDNFVFLLAGIAFFVEFYLTGRGFTGLGGIGYIILSGLAFFCAICCGYLSMKPNAFFADFLLSTGIFLKGSWILQLGLSLYTDTFNVKGCGKISNVGSSNAGIDVKCELEDDRLRGMAVINLLFLGHFVMVMIVSFVLFSLLHRNRNLRCGETSGHLLAEVGSEGNLLMHQLPVFEIE